MSRALRSVKNVTKGYSSVQVKVRNGELRRTIGLSYRAQPDLGILLVLFDLQSVQLS